jgi:xylulokinase
MLLRGLSVMPHPGRAGRSVLAVHPTGNAVMDWARDLVGAEIETLEADLNDRMAPSPLQAVPYLSGSMVYWEEGRKATGALVGLTLATTPTDVVQAFMEGIAYDHVNTLSLMRQEGVPVSRLRATGGGTRSAWWTQLKADLTDLPIEVVDQPEPGTLGAAILAGLAIGVFDDLEETCATLSRTRRVHEPDPRRSEGHGDRFERYRKTVTALLREVY